ncbi:MAG: hypothetical protein ACKVWR_03195 [Acidimicrobiales bacterium]
MGNAVGAKTASRSRRWLFAGIGFGAVVAAAAVVIAVYAGTRLEAPSFPSLAEQPDASLQGTVAYIGPGDDGGWCVHLASASGEIRRRLPVCASPNTHLVEQLSWTDGQVEIVDPGQHADKEKGWEERAPWHVLVDPATGATTDLAVTDLPPAPDPATLATSGGRTVRTISKDGVVRMELADAAGVRTVWTSKGRSNLWEVGQPAWSPDGAWLLAHDGADRLLLFTISGDTAGARVLVPKGAGGAFAIGQRMISG